MIRIIFVILLSLFCCLIVALVCKPVDKSAQDRRESARVPTRILANLANRAKNVPGRVPLRAGTKMEDPLQLGFLKGGFILTSQRIGLIDKETKTALANIQICKTILSGKDPDDENRCFELRDRGLIISHANFLRWRLNSLDYLWGTECSLDDHEAGIFRIPFRIMKPLTADKVAIENNNERFFIGTWAELRNFLGGESEIRRLWSSYAWDRDGGLSATAHMPSSEGWPRDLKGIYFDFVPAKNEDRIMLFILFDKARTKFSSEEDARAPNSILEMWEAAKGWKDISVEDGAFDGSESLIDRAYIKRMDLDAKMEWKRGWISTDMTDPFYSFERNNDFYFVTTAGKIYLALHASIDPDKIERLIADLDSDSFATRENATRNLRSIGKPTQGLLKARLATSNSQEQKRRITQLLDELKPLPDRETKLLWKDEKRPVDKLLFDLDKNKVYAFTKPSRDKQVYYFEIADKPQPRLFAGNPNPDTPASVPASTRTFLEYARFVRKEK